MSNPSALVQKLWNNCDILRDDGLSCGDLASQGVAHGGRFQLCLASG